MTTISIITPSYNAESTIHHCFHCINKQGLDVEHIVVDGLSTDGTLALVEQLKSNTTKVISEPDDGLYDAMNKGIQAATGEIVGILNADDYYPSDDVLSKVVEVFNDPEIDACYGDLIYVNEDHEVVRDWKSGDYKQSSFYQGWMPPHPTFFVRRSVYEKYGLFKLNLGSSGDYEIMLRFLLKCKIKMKYIPETLVHMRTGGVSNASVSNRVKANQMDHKAWKVNDLKPYPWTLAMKPLRKLNQWKLNVLFSVGVEKLMGALNVPVTESKGKGQPYSDGLPTDAFKNRGSAKAQIRYSGTLDRSIVNNRRATAHGDVRLAPRQRERRANR